LASQDLPPGVIIDTPVFTQGYITIVRGKNGLPHRYRRCLELQRALCVVSACGRCGSSSTLNSD